MRLLLDTYVLLWLAAAPERLGNARSILEDDANELLLSAASASKLSIKYASGRLSLPEPPLSWLSARLQPVGLTPLDVTWRDAAAAGQLPPLHRDPFDRMLVAQAQRHDVLLATADRSLAGYDVRRLEVG